jgi:hypothetical protein
MKKGLLVLVVVILNLFWNPDLKAQANSKDEKIKLGFDSLCQYRATVYLKQNLGQKFFEDYLIYYSVERAGGTRVVFFSLKENLTKGENKLLPIYCNHFYVDTLVTKISKNQITDCIDNKQDCILFLDKQTVYNIGIKAGLKLEKTPFTIYFELNGGKINDPRWLITTTDYEDNRGYSGGKSLLINAKTGTYELAGWQSQP